MKKKENNYMKKKVIHENVEKMWKKYEKNA